MQRTNPTRNTRRAFTTAATCVAVGGLMLATSGTAGASTVVEDSCTGEAHGAGGDTVAVSGDSVSDAVKEGAQQAKDDLGGGWRLSIHPDTLADHINDLDSIELDTVSDEQQSDTAADLGQQTRDLLDEHYPNKLPPLGLRRDDVLDSIKNNVTDQCDLTVSATDDATSTKSGKSTGSSGTEGSSGKATTEDSDGAAQGTGKAKQGSGDSEAPRRDYSGIPSASAPHAKKGGSSAKMGDPSKMDAPPKASLPQDRLPSGKQDSKQGANADHSKVANAGKADALNEQSGPQRVQVPMLLAVVALALATAGLVRSWVLRRI